MKLRFIRLVPFLLASSLGANTITVTIATDAVANGDGCTLREAILNANANNQSGSTDCAAGSGADVIQFAIGTGSQTIFPLTELPAITNTLTIDGTTQPLYAGAPLIELNGTMTTISNGLTLSAPN